MKETVIQFGEGNFLRGFFDFFLDVMNKKGIYDGKAVVIQPRSCGKCALLNAQDCKYNLYLRGIDKGELKNEHHYIESISRAVDPYHISQKTSPILGLYQRCSPRPIITIANTEHIAE